MVCINEKNMNNVKKTFTAQINVHQSHHTSIRINYEPFLHIGTIRQSARIVEIYDIKSKNNIDKDNIVLRTNDRAKVKMTFAYRPEYITSNMKLIFREGKIRASGYIIDED